MRPAGLPSEALAIAIVIALAVPVVLWRVARLVRWARTEGKKDVREVFGFGRAAGEAEAAAALEAWEKEEGAGSPVPEAARRSIEPLEAAYAQGPSAATTLALARAYEERGLRSLAQVYYQQLLSEFGDSEEARLVRGARPR